MWSNLGVCHQICRQHRFHQLPLATPAITTSSWMKMNDSPNGLISSFRRIWGSRGRRNIPSKGFKGVEYDFRGPTADAVIDYPAFARYPLSRRRVVSRRASTVFDESNIKSENRLDDIRKIKASSPAAEQDRFSSIHASLGKALCPRPKPVITLAASYP